VLNYTSSHKIEFVSQNKIDRVLYLKKIFFKTRRIIFEANYLTV